MQKVLITGVAGFIGAHVARRFAADGYHVVGVDDLSMGKRENIPAQIEFIEGDLALERTIARLPADCAKILHIAGQSSGEISFDNPVDDLSKNTISTLNLIRYGIAQRAQRIVYASSMSVYGAVADAPVKEAHACAPLSCYGVGKRASEDYLRVYASQLPYVALRMFNVYGPGQDLANLRQGMVSIYLAQALAEGRIEVKGSTERFRDFIYIDDVVEAWVRAASRTEALNTTLNVGTGRRTSVAELLGQLSSLIEGASYFTRGGTPGDQTGIYADTQQIRAVLGMETFTSLERGLPQFVEWARGTMKQRSGRLQT